MFKNRSYFLHLLKQHRPIVILYFILCFAGSPLQLILAALNRINEGYYYSGGSGEFYQATFLLFSFAIIMAMVTPYITFSYLFSKSNLDTYFALPVSRTKLFSMQLLFTWLTHLVPILVANTSTFIGAYVLNRLFGSELFPFTTQSLVTFGVTTLAFFLGSLILMIPSLLAILYTTSIFNALLYGGVLHVLPYIINFIWLQNIAQYFGYMRPLRDSMSIGLGNSLIRILPHQNYASIFTSILHERELYITMRNHALITLAIHFAVAMVLVFLARYLYKKRKVERVHSSTMFTGFYETIITVTGALLLSTILGDLFRSIRYNSNYTSVVFVFFLGFAAYYIINIIRYHGLPKFFRTFLSYIGVFALAVVLTLLFDYFAVEVPSKDVPDTKEIAAVKIINAEPQYDHDLRNSSSFTTFEPYGYAVEFHEVKSRESNVIDHARQLQKMIVEEWEAKNRIGYDFYEEDVVPINIYYYDHRGNLIQQRQYALKDQMQIDLLEDILGEEAYHFDPYQFYPKADDLLN